MKPNPAEHGASSYRWRRKGATGDALSWYCEFFDPDEAAAVRDF